VLIDTKRARGGYSNILVACLALGGIFLVLFIASSMYSWRLAAEDSATDLYIVATEFADGGDYPGAIETLKTALRFNRSDARIYYELGNAYYFAGDDEMARTAWAEALRLDPSQEKGRSADGLTRPRSGVLQGPPAVHADPNEVWTRRLRLSGWDISQIFGVAKIQR
jgi:tetratricopeptide (TPR) repeat protein